MEKKKSRLAQEHILLALRIVFLAERCTALAIKIVELLGAALNYCKNNAFQVGR
ncbi:hypothetical protein [Salinicola avicenniae]|uniref:hypothetical protein n=1 Tax=Salinicola avicenniae TaxID=2916836 RepID=UPI00207409CB|nr:MULTISPECIES: hypothetical protein [unclassified Salinicola]